MDEQVFAIEAELSTKKPFKLAENLMELIRSEEYLRLKMDFGVRWAQAMSTRYQSWYSKIWYFVPEKVRKQVRRAQARLVRQGDLSKQEAERLFVRWYPLAYMGAETVQEDQEEDLDLEDIDKDRPSSE